ncbi:MAG: peptidoglycan editing factor PgeF [Cyanobacteria bacterium K_DeepCast_35m_m2_023]|nr:peptidoglycan editing factor PgeF [Cyanobacteria bacterium K_DeepCast_35m_m2_023]
MAEAVDAPFDRPDAGFNDLAGWSWIGCYGGYYLYAELLAGFEHGFFTRQWQGRGPDVLAGYVSAGVSVHRPQQVHSATVLSASCAQGEPWPEADGLVSDAGGQSLWVCGADCTPVLVADPSSGRVAACHAGWRGVAGGILQQAIGQLEARGCRRQDLLVALGPAISGDKYQVDGEVVAAMARSLEAGLGSEARALDALLSSRAVRPEPEAERWRLDIRQVAALQLQQLGIESIQQAICPLCTFDEPLLFHSWRRDQVKAVQWSGIVAQA